MLYLPIQWIKNFGTFWLTPVHICLPVIERCLPYYALTVSQESSAQEQKQSQMESKYNCFTIEMSWTVQPEDIAEGFPLNVHQNRIRARGFKDRENKDYFNINNIFEGLYLKSIWGKYFPAGYFMAIFFIIIFITSNTLAKKIKWTVSQYTSTQLSHPKRSN